MVIAILFGVLAICMILWSFYLSSSYDKEMRKMQRENDGIFYHFYPRIKEYINEKDIVDHIKEQSVASRTYNSLPPLTQRVR